MDNRHRSDDDIGLLALKVLSPEALRDPTMRERSLREARAQAALAHPHMVPIYYIGEQDGTHFFAMEFVAGESLEARSTRGEPLDVAPAVQQLTAVANALKLAHKRGFIHRDIKPSNLLVDESGTIKVADFGLARPVADHAQLTQTGAIIGTPLYMSPEQAQGDEVDHRADIHSLGASYYHLLTGAPPFSAATPLGLITKHITQPLPPLRSRAPQIDAGLAAVIERMLEKDRAKRYQDYDALLDALAAARPNAVQPAGFWVRAMAFGADLIALLLVGVFLAMGAASASVAIAGSTDEALTAAGFVMLHPRLGALPELLAKGRRLNRVIRANYVWAFAFNGVFVPVAAAGYLTPLAAMLLMLLSSSAVLLNALRLRR